MFTHPFVIWREFKRPNNQKNDKGKEKIYHFKAFFILFLPLLGSFSYRFTVPGVYYYSSGYVDSYNSRLLQGVVKVRSREEKSSSVSVSVGGLEALYMAGGTDLLR